MLKDLVKVRLWGITGSQCYVKITHACFLRSIPNSLLALHCLNYWNMNLVLTGLSIVKQKIDPYWSVLQPPWDVAVLGVKIESNICKSLRILQYEYFSSQRGQGSRQAPSGLTHLWFMWGLHTTWETHQIGRHPSADDSLRQFISKTSPALFMSKQWQCTTWFTPPPSIR